MTIQAISPRSTLEAEGNTIQDMPEPDPTSREPRYVCRSCNGEVIDCKGSSPFTSDSKSNASTETAQRRPVNGDNHQEFAAGDTNRPDSMDETNHQNITVGHAVQVIVQYLAAGGAVQDVLQNNTTDDKIEKIHRNLTLDDVSHIRQHRTADNTAPPIFHNITAGDTGENIHQDSTACDSDRGIPQKITAGVAVQTAIQKITTDHTVENVHRKFSSGDTFRDIREDSTTSDTVQVTTSDTVQDTTGDAIQDIPQKIAADDAVPDTHQDFAAGDEKEIPYHCSARCFQIVPGNDIKNNRRALRRSVLEKKITRGMLRRALSIHNLEIGISKISTEIFSALEHLLGLEDVPWPSDYERRCIILEKIDMALRALLQQYGYRSFTFFSEDHKSRLRIMPRSGRAPPKLPQWLRISYLVPVKGVRQRIILEGCANARIQSGDPICEESNDSPVGSLGTVMVSKNSHVVLTAGHIIADGDRNLIVRRNNGELAVNLKIPTNSVRHSGRPLGRLQEKSGFQDDCGFLIVSQDDVAKFDHPIVCGS